MKITVHGPAAGPGPDGMITSWAPDQPVEIDDADKQAVEWARSFAATGMATITEDAPPPAPKAAPRSAGGRA